MQLAAECAVRLDLQDIKVSGLCATHRDGSAEVYLVYSVAGWPLTPRVSNSCRGVRAASWPRNLPPVQGHSHLPDLLQESMLIELWAHATESCAVEQLLGHTVVPLSACVQAKTCAIRFDQPLELHGKPSAQISGQLEVVGLPRCAQMVSGVHQITPVSECVAEARPLLNTLELPQLEVQLVI